MREWVSTHSHGHAAPVCVVTHFMRQLEGVWVRLAFNLVNLGEAVALPRAGGPRAGSEGLPKERSGSLSRGIPAGGCGLQLTGLHCRFRTHQLS